MKKRIFAALMMVLLLAGALAGCGTRLPAQDGRLSLVVTIFPEYDWLRNIAGEHFDDMDVKMLLDSGVDLHSYQPTAEDMVRLSTCDMFVYVGGESDAWADDALRELDGSDTTVVCLLDELGEAAKEEEVVEGMMAEDEEEEEEDGPEYDEHVWLSLRNAAALCRVLCDRLSALDPANAADYAANTDAYIARLEALDAQFAAAVEAAPRQTVLFGDRFPFRYLADDYGLTYYAAFSGCSAETEASFETIVFLANKVDELGLPAILQIESADGSIAETIRQNTAAKDQAILSMDSMQSCTARDVAAGADYLAIMEENLAVLGEALNG